MSTKERVKKLLTEKPKTRDCDRLLCSWIWYVEAQDKNCTFLEFLGDYKHGKFTSSFSIERARRKLQEEHPELRGKKYEARKGKEITAKNDINVLFKDSDFNNL